MSDTSMNDVIVTPLFATGPDEPAWVIAENESDPPGQPILRPDSQPSHSKKCPSCGQPEHGFICENI